ncbi:hypothetical protein F8C76_01795 [Flagellimonas olearia]|uniref:Endonuclease/exonuclease/phosphatase domain-containing protein n=1 Tax=Flagellimonas olearia TaxID=552546 RepID=A0A6I1E329_9FLAO|nr:endonuclease/exonuclease/phosphatase family protein [Allomuricauda olearia]KAB7530265.1 hypothetical protein F8C76_01795 [Allomuricauda olearia]
MKNLKKSKSSVVMWISLFVLSFIACSSEAETDKENTPPEEGKEYVFRILTYNIFHGEKTNGDIDMDRFAEIINNESPDIVALQEVDKGVERSERLDIAMELGQRTGMDSYFFKFRDFQGGDYGSAILSTYPIREEHLIQGYRTGSTGVVIPFVKLEIDQGTYVYFNTSHFSTELEEREVHIKQAVNYYVNKVDRAPTLICGDLNAEPGSSEMEVVFEEFSESDKSLGNTFSTRTGMRKKIDYILHPKNDNWEVMETKRICPGDASDHCALLAVIKYRKP